MLRPSDRRGIAVAGAAVAVLVAACSSGPVTLSPSAPLAATATPAATALTSNPAGSPVSVGPIAEAKYVSEPNDVAAILARIKADPKLTPAEVAESVNDYANIPDAQVFGLDFSAGSYTETQTGANGNQVGARGRYAADDKTLVLGGIGTFAITPVTNGFALKLVKQELPGEFEALAAEIIFESSPFIRTGGPVQAIPDGTYVGKVVKTANVKALVDADKKLTPAQRADLSGLWSGHTTMQVQLVFHAGAFSEAVALDGGAFEIGVRATYAFPDDRSLLTQDQGVDTFKVTWASGAFSLERTGPPIADARDAMFGRILFGSTPFTLVP